jgi:hypothetical protein
VAFALVSARRAAMASSNLRRCPMRPTAKSFRSSAVRPGSTVSSRPALDDLEKRQPRHGGPATAEASDFQRVISDDPTQTFLDHIPMTWEKMIAA